MRYNQLGNTGLYVSELCLGTANFAHDDLDPDRWKTMEQDAFGHLDQKTVDALMERALRAGVNYYDTADSYMGGASEIALGRSLKTLGTKRGDVVLGSKFGVKLGREPNNRGGSRQHIMDSVQRSLERIQTDYIDLYQIHIQDSVTPLEEILRAIDDLVSQGLIHYFGVSNWYAWRVMKALAIADRHGWARPQTVQAYYSIAGRDLEHELVPLLEEERLGLLVWSPLAGGLLSGKYEDIADDDKSSRGRRSSFDIPPVDRALASVCIQAMKKVAEKRQAPVATVALAWLLGKPHVTSVIMGARRLDQLEANLAAVDLVLTQEEMADLDAASSIPAPYPRWMIELQEPMRRPKIFKPK